MPDAEPLILYGMGSPNVRKVIIMLEELGLPYELRHVEVFKSEQYAPEFLAMNPVAKVPVLVDPKLGQPLAESGAILFWLAERSGGAFLSADAPARYEVIQWLMTQMSLVGPMLGQFNHYRLLPRDEPYSYGRYQAQSERVYRILDDRLAKHEWLAGDAYSIADIATYPWADYVERHGFDPSPYPALLRWRERIAGRPAVVRAAEQINTHFSARTQEARQAATNTDLDRFFGRTEAMPDADFASVMRR